MSEIPEDIWIAADKLLDVLCKEARINDLDPWTVAGRAILAERERAAKIAEQRDPEKPDNYLLKRENIAAAIRTPSTGEEQ